ncbi:MAG: hypothetical protein U0R76_09340 [Candidatus Nanopelagicales bacterium]
MGSRGRRVPAYAAALLALAACARPAAPVVQGPDPDHVFAYDLQVHLPLGDAKLGTPEDLARFGAVEDELMPVMDSVGGILDGNDIGAGEYTINLMADDVDAATAAVRAALADDDLPEGSALIVYRWGPDGDQGDPLSTTPVGRGT